MGRNAVASRNISAQNEYNPKKDVNDFEQRRRECGLAERHLRRGDGRGRGRGILDGDHDGRAKRESTSQEGHREEPRHQTGLATCICTLPIAPTPTHRQGKALPQVAPPARGRRGRWNRR